MQGELKELCKISNSEQPAEANAEDFVRAEEKIKSLEWVSILVSGLSSHGCDCFDRTLWQAGVRVPFVLPRQLKQQMQQMSCRAQIWVIFLLRKKKSCHPFLKRVMSSVKARNAFNLQWKCVQSIVKLWKTQIANVERTHVTIVCALGKLIHIQSKCILILG